MPNRQTTAVIANVDAVPQHPNSQTTAVIANVDTTSPHPNSRTSWVMLMVDAIPASGAHQQVVIIG